MTRLASRVFPVSARLVRIWEQNGVPITCLSAKTCLCRPDSVQIAQELITYKVAQ